LSGLQTLIFATFPAITYTKCCMLGFDSLFVNL
jgi:hypothetical protein